MRMKPPECAEASRLLTCGKCICCCSMSILLSSSWTGGVALLEQQLFFAGAAGATVLSPLEDEGEGAMGADDRGAARREADRLATEELQPQCTLALAALWRATKRRS